eukprot:gene50401-68519_t
MVLGLTAVGVIPLRALIIAMVIFSLMTVLNQLRTAVAHYWENDGEQMAVLDQFLDTVNVPPPAMLPFLWAPVGSRHLRGDGGGAHPRGGGEAGSRLSLARTGKDLLGRRLRPSGAGGGADRRAAGANR